MSQSQAVLDTRLAPLVAGTASESGADPSSFAEATDPAMPSTCDQHPSDALCAILCKCSPQCVQYLTQLSDQA